MVTQETHYMSMVQLVEPSLTVSMDERKPKKLWCTVAYQARLNLGVWMTNFHCQQQGGAHNWLNLIRVTVPQVTGSNAPVYQNNFLTLYTTIIGT
jgi:hypothetical protein